MKARSHVYVSGLVQGVFYRSSAKKKAQELGLSGWVRNLRDGRVEAVFEGQENRVDEMIGWCRRGPEGSVVESVEVIKEKPSSEFTGFRIIY